MTPEKMVSIIDTYERNLRRAKIREVRMSPKRTFASLGVRKILEHAHFLCNGAKQFALDPQKWGKANRHLTAIQMCLSFAGWYTLEDLMSHNRPKAAKMTARK